MGLAQTGTGKTAAFALPILERLIKGPRGSVRALIIAPTRELAEQIHEAIGALGRQTKLRSITIYGGVGVNPQIQKLRAGVDIVVACPGRLLDHINQGTIDLSRIEVLVLDEADRMFDMGFLPDIRRILKHVPAKRQTLLFSATMPDDIRKLAHEVLHNPVTVQVGHTAPVNTVSHALYPVPQHLKTALLLELLKHTDTDSVLIFTRTKHRAKRVGQQLEKAGYRAASLQGNLSQNKRQAALDGFRDGSFQILVATDIAARGIDVSSISHVINYDMPDTADAYTHRIGRTGRAAKTGDAFTFITREDEDMVRSIERVLGEMVERRTL
jgi:ATP-dependent RNA helicase RhlE